MLLAQSPDGAALGILLLGLGLAAAVFTIWTLFSIVLVPYDVPFQAGTKALWVVIVLLTGVVGAMLYQFIGKPVAGASPGPTTERAKGTSTLSPDGHPYRWNGERWKYECMARGCGFTADTDDRAKAHSAATVETSEKTERASIRDEERAPVDAAVTELAGFKICPDCAEEIRFAARKCRFCGYRYSEEAAK